RHGERAPRHVPSVKEVTRAASFRRLAELPPPGDVPPAMRPSFLIAIAAAFALAFAPSDARTAGADPAARGLDLFVHVPADAAAGSFVPVQVEAFGFPTAVSLVPLAQATVEAGWDAEHLGPGISTAPPTVRATTDASGRARLEVPVPDGDERDLQ